LFDIEEKTSMTSLRRGTSIASTLMLIAVLLSACNKPYSQASAATFTPLPPNSVFGTLQPTSELGPVAGFATGSAIAQMTSSPSAPTATLGAGVTPQPQVATATNTPLAVIPSATLAVPSGPSSTPVPASAGNTYVLKPGEFPYCIARRYNVDPDEMLRLSGLSDGVIYDPGTVLKIPQSGKPFPGDRMLKTHPATYTVLTPNETVYSIACLFGDVDPDAIARANNIPVGSTTPIPINTVLNIP
jgi:LysM repeat protein